MLVGDVLDTVLNLGTFAFVAAMVWLLVRPLSPGRPDPQTSADVPDDHRTG